MHTSYLSQSSPDLYTVTVPGVRCVHLRCCQKQDKSTEGNADPLLEHPAARHGNLVNKIELWELQCLLPIHPQMQQRLHLRVKHCILYYILDSLILTEPKMTTCWGLCNSRIQGIQIAYEICPPTLACLHWQLGFPTNARIFGTLLCSCSTSLMTLISFLIESLLLLPIHESLD